mmetsp:Transcript_117644/g.340094  ORF Transcript_117644/g.340094 Transcript_117644/m.340094 type:complete len:538 (+) Transcript_117644:82-1695(+)
MLQSRTLPTFLLVALALSGGSAVWHVEAARSISSSLHAIPPTSLRHPLTLTRGGASASSEKKSKKSKKNAKVEEEEEEEDETAAVDPEEVEEDDDEETAQEVDEEDEEEEESEVEEDEEEEADDDEVEEENEEAVSTSTSSKTGKKAISDAMKEKDAAEALGDAIRDRADTLRSEDPLLQSIDWSVGSLGQALGASDRIRREGGGVQASQSSVIANYFIKSHGGAHALQCVCSALCTMSGLAAIMTYPRPNSVGLTYTLLQRTFLFAMLKHVSGMLAAASIAAKAIPKIGLSQARQWMEKLVMDPVSQYVFFNALMLLWLPQKQRVLDGQCWWWSKSYMIPLMIGPIMLREVISNLLVISDVMVLWNVGSESKSSAIETILKVSQAIINAIMSLLVTPTVWRAADAAKRQAILSKLVSRVSLVFEVAIGALLFMDATLGVIGAAFMSGAKRPPFKENLTRMICVRLYIHFLWVRRAKIKKVATKMRGGAASLPFYILDILDHPARAMGIVSEAPSADESYEEMTWLERLSFGLGLRD